MKSEKLEHKQQVFIIAYAYHKNLNGILEILVPMMNKKTNNKRVRHTTSPIAESGPDAPIFFFVF